MRMLTSNAMIVYACDACDSMISDLWCDDINVSKKHVRFGQPNKFLFHFFDNDPK